MSSTVYPTAIVCEGVQLGEGCMIGTHVYIGKYCIRHAHQHGAFLPNKTQVGARCFVDHSLCLPMTNGLAWTIHATTPSLRC
jgi:acetyltransferase-like isoleucine patch superfamily enzyme